MTSSISGSRSIVEEVAVVVVVMVVDVEVVAVVQGKHVGRHCKQYTREGRKEEEHVKLSLWNFACVGKVSC